MEENKKKPAEDHTSGAATVERGKQAIAADEEINKKEVDPSKRKEEGARDADKWHNEG